MAEKETRLVHDFGGGIPSSGEILQLLRDLGMPENIIDHSVMVRDISMEITGKILKNNPDVKIEEDLVEAGALLHDLGRIKTHGIEHGFVGGLIIRDLNIDERVARCAMVHVLGGLALDEIQRYFPPEIRNQVKEPLIPRSLEEKIICFADKQVNGTKRVTLRKRFSRWFKKHGRTSFLIRARVRVLQLEKEILALI